MKSKQLLHLALGEFAASLAFILAYLSLDLGKVSLVSLILLVFFLIQGSIYWLLRYVSLIRRVAIHLKVVKWFSFLRVFNLVICVWVLGMIPGLITSHKDLWIGAGIYIFALIEYVNYYWFRLSYGKTGFNLKILLDRKYERSSISKLISKKANRSREKAGRQ